MDSQRTNIQRLYRMTKQEKKMTNEKAQNIAREILKELGINPEHELYLLYSNKLIGFIKNNLLKSIKHELRSLMDAGEPVNAEFFTRVANFHKVTQVIVLTVKKIATPGGLKRTLGYAPFGVNPGEYKEAQALGESITTALQSVQKPIIN